ncbi:MAG: divalent-cation tolerance protein CutA [Desulfobacteraceae bacterium]|nr:divalent-cation tolerance protein CutA [Desulfobacteraceae bacterium]
MDTGGKKDLIKVITTTENEEDARRIAKDLVEKRLCACAQVSGPITSYYWWDGAVQSSTEWQCAAKAPAQNYKDIERAILKIHPYKLPQIIAIPIIETLSDYKDWIMEATKKPFEF